MTVSSAIEWLLNNTPREPFERACKYLQKTLGRANMEKSTHKAEVVEVNLEKHENADSLSVFQVFGYSYVAKTESWLGIKKAAFLPPDTLVDTTRPEFLFFATEKRLYEIDGRKVWYRIKAKKIRGIVSYGFCVPVPDETELGEDWAEKLGIVHFDEEVHSATKQKGISLTGGEVESPPNCYHIKYDVDALRRYKGLMVEGEPVWVSEKQHGSNARYVFHNNKMYCGSRGEWKREYATPPNFEDIKQKMTKKFYENAIESINEEELNNRLSEIQIKITNFKSSQNAWWKVYHKYPGIKAFCEGNPDYVLYGELLGSQDLKYGLKSGEVGFSAFDILKPDGNFMNVMEFFDVCANYQIPVVPTVDVIPYDFDKICSLAEGKSLVADHTREGVVVKPMVERLDKRVGRICFKVVGVGYLERA